MRKTQLPTLSKLLFIMVIFSAVQTSPSFANLVTNETLDELAASPHDDENAESDYEAELVEHQLRQISGSEEKQQTSLFAALKQYHQYKVSHRSEVKEFKSNYKKLKRALRDPISPLRLARA